MSKNYFFAIDIPTFLYILKKEGKKTLFKFPKYVFLHLHSKLHKKVVGFSFTTTKNISTLFLDIGNFSPPIRWKKHRYTKFSKHLTRTI